MYSSCKGAQGGQKLPFLTEMMVNLSKNHVWHQHVVNQEQGMHLEGQQAQFCQCFK